MFEPFPKLARFSHDWTVTEKIDGTNGQIIVVRKGDPRLNPQIDGIIIETGDHYVMAGSRNRLLRPDNDNHGFAKFVADRAEEIVEKLGEGRHFGEWYGQGIGPRGYGVNPKRFALFNAGRWTGQELPDRFDVVPILFQGYLADAAIFDNQLERLRLEGSRIAPGFMKPEGIVMYHGPSRTSFKKTFDYDEAGKWAEKQERNA